MPVRQSVHRASSKSRSSAARVKKAAKTTMSAYQAHVKKVYKLIGKHDCLMHVAAGVWCKTTKHAVVDWQNKALALADKLKHCKPGVPAVTKKVCRKSASRKSASRKSASRKSASRKSASRKSASRKSASRKSASRKSASRKSASRKSASRRSPSRRSPSRRPSNRVVAVAR